MKTSCVDSWQRIIFLGNHCEKVLTNLCHDIGVDHVQLWFQLSLRHPHPQYEMWMLVLVVDGIEVGGRAGEIPANQDELVNFFYWPSSQARSTPAKSLSSVKFPKSKLCHSYCKIFHLKNMRSSPNTQPFTLGFSVGIRESWSLGVLEFGSPGVRESQSPGVLESQSLGVSESWSPGVLNHEL